MIQRTLAFDLKPSDKVTDRAKVLAQDLFAKVDTDGGGTVCYDEYSAWLNANPEYAYNFTCSVGSGGDDGSKLDVTKRGNFSKQLSMKGSTRQLEIRMRRSISDKDASMTLQSKKSSAAIMNPLQSNKVSYQHLRWIQPSIEPMNDPVISVHVDRALSLLSLRRRESALRVPDLHMAPHSEQE